MPINVSGALNSDTAELVTVERRSSGSFVDGIWTPSGDPVTTFRTYISVQQPSPQQLTVLPESERTSDVRLFISAKPLRVGMDKPRVESDVILYGSEKYRVISLGDWNAYGHSTVLGVRIKNDS